MHHVDPLAPRWHFDGAQWVKIIPTNQDTNPEYVSVPYEDLWWSPEKGFTTPASNS